MIAIFFNGLDVLYHHAKFGEDTENTCTGCRCENVFFFCPAPIRQAVFDGVHSSNDHCVAIYGSI